MANGTKGFLSGVVVLDLTDEKGPLAGKMLADLGADVIKVEPPEGCPSRRLGPFVQDIAGPERSLSWAFYNANKRSVTVDISSGQGRDLFKKLVAKADILIESLPLGRAEELGIGHEVLSRVNPRLIHTSITPFGRSGPLKDYQVTDLVAMAMGGLMYLTGEDDRAPVRVGYPQAYLHAGADAAVASLEALYHRELTGQGQLVDVSIQESQLRTTLNAPLTWYYEKYLLTRQGTSRIFGPNLRAPVVWPCKDGCVGFQVLGGQLGGKIMRPLGKWLVEEGLESEFISKTDFASFDLLEVTSEMLEQVVGPISQLFLRYTKMELFAQCIKRGITLFPVSRVNDILDDEHLMARGFWQDMDYPVPGGSFIFPKPPFQIDGEYPSGGRRAPRIGEHNEEIYGQVLGLSPKEIAVLKKARAI